MSTEAKPKAASLSEVYAAIQSERDYQNSLRKDGTFVGVSHEVGEHILMIEEYAALARSAWVRHAGNDSALDVVRKIAGLCVRCMEEHGAPLRVPRPGGSKP